MTNKKLDLNTLLQKASAYEKLAIFGSRKNFLSAMAQAAPALNGSLRQEIEGIANNLSAVPNPNARTLANKLLDHLNNPQVNLQQLAGDLHQASNTFPGDASVQVQNALNASQAVQQLAQPAAAPEAPAVMQMPTDHITGYAPINPRYQELLGVKPDGKLGPETRKALEAYKTKIGKPGLSDGATLGLLMQNNSETYEQSQYRQNR